MWTINLNDTFQSSKYKNILLYQLSITTISKTEKMNIDIM